MGGILVASLVCLMPLFSSQSDDSRNFRDLQFAFLIRHPQLYDFRLDKIEASKRNGLVQGRQAFLNGDFEGCLNSLRQPITTREQDSLDDLDSEDEIKALRNDCRNFLLHDVAWPAKLVVGLSAELDGEKDPLLFSVIDSGTGPSGHSLELKIKGWRSSGYKVLEAEDLTADNHTGSKSRSPIDSPIRLQTSSFQRPKESSVGQVLFIYLSKKDYVAEVYIMKDGHLRRYRWRSSKVISVGQDRLRVYNSDLQKFEEWTLQGSKWTIEHSSN